MKVQFDPQPGDVMLCRKPSFLQGLNEAAGDPYRHSGIVAFVGGELRCVQVHDDVIASENYHDFVSRYSEVAVLRCRRLPVALDVADWAVRQLGVDRKYPLEDCFLAGVVAEARVAGLTAARLRHVVAAAVRQAGRRPQVVGRSCSAFIAEAFAAHEVPLVRTLAVPLRPVTSIRFGPAEVGPELAPLRPNPRQLVRMARDLRVMKSAFKEKLCETSRPTSHVRLILPGDLARSPLLSQVALYQRGAVVPSGF